MNRLICCSFKTVLLSPKGVVKHDLSSLSVLLVDSSRKKTSSPFSREYLNPKNCKSRLEVSTPLGKINIACYGTDERDESNGGVKGPRSNSEAGNSQSRSARAAAKVASSRGKRPEQPPSFSSDDLRDLTRQMRQVYIATQGGLPKEQQQLLQKQPGNPSDSYLSDRDVLIYQNKSDVEQLLRRCVIATWFLVFSVLALSPWIIYNLYKQWGKPRPPEEKYFEYFTILALVVLVFFYPAIFRSYIRRHTLNLYYNELQRTFKASTFTMRLNREVHSFKPEDIRWLDARKASILLGFFQTSFFARDRPFIIYEEYFRTPAYASLLLNPNLPKD